ncbi:MAG: hypothetical protein WC449_04980 [Candidatus Paceibacterota bacterium]
MSDGEGVLYGCLLIVVLMLVIAVLSAIPVLILWNWLMPDLFGLQTINLWQAIGISVLCSLLFKSSVPSNSSNK